MGEARQRRAKGEPPKGARRRLRRRMIAGAVTAVVVVGLGALYYVLTTPGVSPVDDLPTAGNSEPFPAALDQYGVAIGDVDAPVVVREFADYQCPACARLAPIMERFREEYVETGQARLVFFDFPLDQHANAVPAAMAARCAGDQDAYWAMQDRLFDSQSGWADTGDPMPRFVAHAEALGLKTDMFNRCMLGGRHHNAVTASREAAAQVRIARTPTLYVDNIRLTSPGWYQLAGVVERELEDARGGE